MYHGPVLSINYLKRVDGLSGAEGNEEDQAAVGNMALV